MNHTQDQLRQARRRTRSEMYPLVEQYLSSPQKREDFCREAGIAVSTLSYWVSKYNREAAESTEHGFVAISVSGNSMSSPVMELDLGAGGCIRFFSYPDPAYVRRLVGVRC